MDYIVVLLLVKVSIVTVQCIAFSNYVRALQPRNVG
jgi:hypothetical protein